MPRKIKNVPVYIAMSVNMAAAAMGLRVNHLRDAIERGELQLRMLPGSSARRLIVEDLISWMRSEHWQPIKRKKRNATHG